MHITSLETMEQIVKNNDSLRWEGWTVISSRPTPTAWTKPEGAYSNGKWYLESRYEPDEKGWNIPNKFVR
jgi:hypothetical protein